MTSISVSFFLFFLFLHISYIHINREWVFVCAMRIYWIPFNCELCPTTTTTIPQFTRHNRHHNLHVYFVHTLLCCVVFVCWLPAAHECGACVCVFVPITLFGTWLNEPQYRFNKFTIISMDLHAPRTMQLTFFLSFLFSNVFIFFRVCVFVNIESSKYALWDGSRRHFHEPTMAQIQQQCPRS